MADPRIKKLADLLVNYSVKVQPGQWVFIDSHIIAEPLANEVIRAVLEAGGLPTIIMESDDILETNLKYANEEQLSWVSPTLKTLVEEADVLIAPRAAGNTKHLSSIDPKKQQLQKQAYQELFKTYITRAAEGDLTWTLTQYPCLAYAQDAEMSLSEYQDFVHAATYTDQEDPRRSAKSCRLVYWQKTGHG